MGSWSAGTSSFSCETRGNLALLDGAGGEDSSVFETVAQLARVARVFNFSRDCEFEASRVHIVKTLSLKHKTT